MTALDRRAFVAAAATSIVAPAAARAKECPAAGMDWMTMSLEARNLAYFNVAHVGADFARQKTESWAAASKTLREQRSKHLNLAYGPGERTKPGCRSLESSNSLRCAIPPRSTTSSS
jgi:arylformamidase